MLTDDNFVSGNDSYGGVFAFLKGGDIIEETMDKIRKLAENCSGLEGFIICNSCAGGTGSGFGSLLLERISNEYKGKSKIAF